MLVEIQNSSGTKLGVISTVMSWESTKRLNRAGTFKFEMPLTDERSSLVQEKRIAYCYRVLGGVGGDLELVGSGVIDNIQVNMNPSQGRSTLVVSGDDLFRELVNRTVGRLKLESSGAPVSTGLADIMAFAPAGWSLDTVNGYATTGNSVYGSFFGESVLGAISTLARNTCEFFRLGAGRKVVWLRDNINTSGLRGYQSLDPDAQNNEDAVLITSLREQQKTFQLVTRVYPFGAGNGDDRLTLEASTESAPAGYTFSSDSKGYYIERDAAVTAYGTIERQIAFDDIAAVSNSDNDVESAANQLFNTALYWLQIQSFITKEYSITIAKQDKLIEPGETIKVEWYEWVQDNSGSQVEAFSVNDDMTILESTTRVTDESVETPNIIVSTSAAWAKNCADIVADSIAFGTVYAAHAQFARSVDSQSESQAMDSSNPFSMRWWFGEEIAIVNSVKLRFRIDPLVSTATAAASGGGATSGGGGASTPTSSGTVGSTNSRTLMGYNTDSTSSADPDPGHVHYIQTESHDHIVNSHTHNVTISSHTHTTPNHTHGISYGVYTDAAGNTFQLSDLTITVNGGSDISGSVTSITGGWYELDITNEVKDSTTLRPKQENNDVTFSTSQKRGQIKTDLTMVTAVQAIGV